MRFGSSGVVTARKFGGEKKFCTFVARPAAPHQRQAARRCMKGATGFMKKSMYPDKGVYPDS